ncbi:RagB/SusD family nutrient uptake outer membrane protein [Hymenobacter sp. UYP22]|uniref:RagB/SusD family nutrient uptake outer membrane protein n=1 Tax=Hymenobacter sp. UYP22 TaxID=3156348 RepID=UPI0033957970
MYRNFSFIKRNALSALCIATLAGGITACKDSFLDVEPQGQQRDTQFFTNQEQALQGVNSIYGNLRAWPLVAFAHLAVTTLTSDDADKGSVSGDAAFLNNFDNFTFSSTEGILNDYWGGQYQGINLCNQVLANVPNINMDATLKNRLLAEAKFLRAYHYFNLVRAYGGVPLVLKPITNTSSPDEINPARASKDEVYTQIVADLTEAGAVLPTTYSAADKGRATKGAALGMLAKVKLYQKQWAEAVSLTDQVIGLGYSLAPDFDQMFRIAGENGPESIFEIQAQTIPGNCDASNSQWAEVQGARPQFGWGFFIPTADLVAAFESGDKRREATILYRGETTPQGDKIDAAAANPYYNQKAYVPSSADRSCGYGKDQNVRILRLGEILLINAEAANEQGQTTKALAAVNQVRARAGLAALTTTDQAALRQAIWKERRVELALESGDRFFDLVRQGRAGTVLRAQGKQFTDGKNELFAIPQQQITITGGKLTQNPGY